MTGRRFVMRTNWKTSSLGVALAGVLMAGTALAQPPASAAPCSIPGVVKASVTAEVAETFVVPFAANSSDLNPVAERILEVAALSYPQQQTLYLRVQGAEPAGESETLVKLDRLTWITAYLVQRDVPHEALVFEEPAMAERMGCASPGQASL
jgi:hypothetical protein